MSKINKKIMPLSMFYKCNLFLFLLLLALSCGEEKNPSKQFNLVIQDEAKTYKKGDKIKAIVQNKSDSVVTNVRYYIDGEELRVEDDSLSLNVAKLGDKVLEAQVPYNGNTLKLEKNLRILANAAPAIYTYEIVAEYPHDMGAFTQGLEFYQDTLYEGTGKNGNSVLRKIDFKTGDIWAETKLEKAYFGEGITVMGDTVYQLTWQSGIGFLYNRNSLRKIGSFQYGKSREGWGLCNDGKTIYKSDGSDKIWMLDPRTLKEKGYLQIVTNTSVFNKANELEYIEGKIYANVWQKESMMIIDAKSGVIEGVVNFAGLKKRVKAHPKLDVFNGIAYNPARETFFVTGKYWDKLFEIVIKPREL